mgnify:CR=1 FL=1
MAIVTSDKKGGYFSQYIRQRINNNKNFISVITGQTGSGKSYSALRLGEILDPDFDADNICFSGTEFMALINGKVKKLHRGSYIMFDEIQITLGHLDYQSVQAKLMNYVLQTFRHRNFILFLTTPDFSFVNASARKLVHSRMETTGINQNKKQVTLKPFLRQVNQKKGDVYEKYLRVWHKEYGVVPLKTLKVGMPSKELIEAYEQKKTEFTNKLNENISKDLEKIDGKGNKAKPLTEKQTQVVEMFMDGLTVKEVSGKLKIAEQSVYTQMGLIGKKGITITPQKDGTEVTGYSVQGYDDN